MPVWHSEDFWIKVDDYFLLLCLTACMTSPSMTALRAAIISNAAAARGNSIVTENISSLRHIKKSTPSQIWKPMSISPVSIHTLACRNGIL